MKQSFALTELYAHRGCYSKEMVNYCVRGLDVVTIEFIINHSDMKLTEKAWFISNHTGLTPHEHDAIAHGCATLAVDMYEHYHPERHPERAGKLIGVTIEGVTYPCNTDSILTITNPVRDALIIDTAVNEALRIAGTKNQQYAFAIYAACSRDPYDRIYSACRAIELAGGKWVESMLEYFLRCSKV